MEQTHKEDAHVDDGECADNNHFEKACDCGGIVRLWLEVGIVAVNIPRDGDGGGDEIQKTDDAEDGISNKNFGKHFLFPFPFVSIIYHIL